MPVRTQRTDKVRIHDGHLLCPHCGLDESVGGTQQHKTGRIARHISECKGNR